MQFGNVYVQFNYQTNNFLSIFCLAITKTLKLRKNSIRKTFKSEAIQKHHTKNDQYRSKYE